jgi:nucleotide-binding universal stress UspA family protein
MSYAVLMTALDLDLPTRGALVASASLAEMFGAHRIGVAAGECALSPYFAEGPIADEFIAQAQADLHSQLKAIEVQFRASCAGRCGNVEWRSAERLPSGFMIAAARAADLVVVGRPNPSTNLMRGPDVANLLMQAGRPVLVVPPDADEFLVERVLIAWKDTREARRAISDAMPLLRKAKEVCVLAIHEAEGNAAVAVAGTDDVVAWLARHGVKSVAIAEPDYGDVGRSIEEHAAEIEADVIVSGAFGHSRFTEWLLGGVTRHLLRSPKNSVLFSH